MKTLLAGSILILFLTGCSDKSGNNNDTELPVITINMPLTGQIFTSGQPIIISGGITDNKYVAEVHIHVTNTNTGTLLMDVHKFPANNTVAFNESITAAAGVNYKIQIVATDKEVNEARATVTVSCN